MVIKQGGAVIKDKIKAREIELKVGDYTIELAEKGDGLRLETDKFTITRGGKTPIKVYLDKAAAKEKGSRPAAGPSPLDKLDPATIPAAERFPWQPKELVGVFGEGRNRHWGHVKAVALSPDGALVAKVFHGEGFDPLVRAARASFTRVLTRKPKASRRGRRYASGGACPRRA